MKDEILNKQQQAKDKFDQLLKEKGEHESRVTEINTELVKLQGEYQAYESLLNTKKKKGVDEALTINVEEDNGNES